MRINTVSDLRKAYRLARMVTDTDWTLYWKIADGSIRRFAPHHLRYMLEATRDKAIWRPVELYAIHTRNGRQTLVEFPNRKALSTLTH